ncbi:hypothetical protein [Undibacterium sp. Ji22W]|uniref:hypothetical protein n=1 Tax=Undibacterium sp. Ji22W TaxID=3413038 RepID=UPI003BF0539F
MPYIGVSLHILVAIFFAVHAIRHGRELYWLMILFAFPLLGSVVYFFAIYLPDSRLQYGARKITTATLKALDPGKELREAQQAFELTPSAQNQMRLAAAYLETGDAQQAAHEYEACLKGPFANEREMLLGAARARLQNGQADAAIELLLKLRQHHADFRLEQVALLLAKAYALAGQHQAAGEEFTKATRDHGSVEAYVEHAVWALAQGDKSTALKQREQIEQMKKHWQSHHFSTHKDLLKRLDAAFAAS